MLLETLLRGMAIGGLLAAGLAMVRDGPLNAARLSGALFCVATAGFVIHTGTGLRDAVGLLQYPAWIFSAGGTAYFWLFAMALFSETRIGLRHAAPIVVMTAIVVAGRLVPDSAQVGTDIAHNILEVALVLHALTVIWRTRDGDLADMRRAIRIPMMAAVGGFCLVLSGFDIAWALGVQDPWIKASQAAALTALALSGGAVFARARDELFLPAGVAREGPAPRTKEGEAPAADRAAIERLDALMADESFWRQPGLTIGAMAEKVGIPEYRLRPLINQTMGHRNFSEFLNGRRIAAAMAELRDPAKARIKIATIAFDLGYASLGPFNRAFKERTGMSPREWRDSGPAPAAPEGAESEPT